MVGRARIKGESELGLLCTKRRERTHISDVVASEGDQAAILAGGFRGDLGGVPTSGDEHLIAQNLPEEVV